MTKPSKPISPFLELDRHGNIRIYSNPDCPFKVSKSKGELLAFRKELADISELKEGK